MEDSVLPTSRNQREKGPSETNPQRARHNTSSTKLIGVSLYSFILFQFNMLARLVSYNIATSSVSQAKQVVFTVELIDVLPNPPSMRDKLCKGEGGQFAIPSF